MPKKEVVSLIEKFERYLDDALGLRVTTREWEGVGTLPFFLRDLYTFHRLLLLDIELLLMEPQGAVVPTPASVQKHAELVREKTRVEPIYVADCVSSYNRKRLIERKVPFVVPGNQMYLPPLGIDLREHFRNVRTNVTQLSPATQVLVIYALDQKKGEISTPSVLAPKLGYSPMTVVRAFSELESAGLARSRRVGRERSLEFAKTGKELWASAQPFLRSPVARSMWVKAHESEALIAGLSALAYYTRLAPPPHPAIALGPDEWKSRKRRGELGRIPHPDADSLQLEIWSYRPTLLAKDRVVDRFSLYLSLRGTADERVESSLDELMEGVEW